MRLFKLSTIIVSLFLLPISTFAQASGYFPNQVGFTWNYSVVYTGAGDTVIPSTLHTEIDSIAVFDTIDGKEAYTIQSRLESGVPNGSSNFSFEGEDAFIYVPGLPPPLDTMINFPPPEWSSVFKFDSVLPGGWTIFEWDTTITIESTTIPALFRIQGSRVSLNENVTVTAGNFTTARFDIIEQVGTKVGPFFVPFITIVDSFWVAQERWIVKHTRQATTFSYDTLSIEIPGVRKELVSSSAPNYIAGEKEFPDVFTLLQNFPNPFNPVTVIRYTLPAPGDVSLKVYNVLGSEVATLVDGIQDAGLKMQTWDAGGMPSGVYLYRLTTNQGTHAKTMMLLK